MIAKITIGVSIAMFFTCNSTLAAVPQLSEKDKFIYLDR